MSFPIKLVFNVVYFRQAFPEFANETVFTTATLQMYWDWATLYVSNINWGWLRNRSRQHALNLMTAHIAQVRQIAKAGEVPGIITDSKVDKVEVKLEPPPLPNQFQWWLGTTGYGQDLLALLQTKSVGGSYYGGPSVLGAFYSGGYYGRNNFS
jgi:ABC-type dipeptide/oligopeptide/nickel transport system permease subunit